MNDILKEYFEKSHAPSILIKNKMKQLSEHPDIKKELETWITSGCYTQENPVEVEGYTAKKLSELSPLLKGEGIFMLLIELRENPERALKRIQSGFKKK